MITSAACRITLANGERVTLRCHRHCDTFETLKLLHVDYDKSSVEQGFIDWNPLEEKEEFVSRVEAAKIAKECKQVLPHMLKEFNPNCCFSEDLW